MQQWIKALIVMKCIFWAFMTHVNKALENICKNKKYDECEKDNLKSEVYNMVKDNNV